VVGGAHPTALHEGVLCRSKADIAVLGEGEITFTEIIKKYQTGIIPVTSRVRHNGKTLKFY
jgi:radical SAM superfamily enzyme YgiQ (UPF0313 family)